LQSHTPGVQGTMKYEYDQNTFLDPNLTFVWDKVVCVKGEQHTRDGQQRQQQDAVDSGWCTSDCNARRL